MDNSKHKLAIECFKTAIEFNIDDEQKEAMQAMLDTYIAAPQMLEALQLLVKARKESTEQFRRVSYSKEVQEVFNMVEKF